MSLHRLAGISFALFGAMLLFYIFAWSTLLPPTLTGAAWWSAVLRTMFGPGAIGTLIGIACVVGGLFLVLQQPRRGLSPVSVVVMTVLAVITLVAVALC